MAVTAVSAVNYIETTELAEPFGVAEESDLPQLKGGKDEQAVVDSSVMDFSENLPLADRQGVGYWLLFAQWAADAAVPDRNDSRAWGDAYRDALLSSGWALAVDDRGWNNTDSVNAEVHESIIPVITAILGGTPALGLVVLALNKLNDMDEGSKWLTLFNRRAKEAHQVGFQVGFADTHKDGGFALKTAEYSLEASRTITQILWFTVDRSDAGFFYRHLDAWLPQDMYDQLLPSMKERISGHAKSYVATVPIAVPGA